MTRSPKKAIGRGRGRGRGVKRGSRHKHRHTHTVKGTCGRPHAVWPPMLVGTCNMWSSHTFTCARTLLLCEFHRSEVITRKSPLGRIVIGQLEMGSSLIEQIVLFFPSLGSDGPESSGSSGRRDQTAKRPRWNPDAAAGGA